MTKTGPGLPPELDRKRFYGRSQPSQRGARAANPRRQRPAPAQSCRAPGQAAAARRRAFAATQGRPGRRPPRRQAGARRQGAAAPSATVAASRLRSSQLVASARAPNGDERAAPRRIRCRRRHSTVNRRRRAAGRRKAGPDGDAVRGTTPTPDVDALAHNIAQAIEQGGKVLAAYLRPRESGEIKTTVADDVGEMVRSIGRVAEYYMADPQRAFEAQTALTRRVRRSLGGDAAAACRARQRQPIARSRRGRQALRRRGLARQSVFRLSSSRPTC